MDLDYGRKKSSPNRTLKLVFGFSIIICHAHPSKSNLLYSKLLSTSTNVKSSSASAEHQPYIIGQSPPYYETQRLNFRQAIDDTAGDKEKKMTPNTLRSGHLKSNSMSNEVFHREWEFSDRVNFRKRPLIQEKASSLLFRGATGSLVGNKKQEDGKQNPVFQEEKRRAHLMSRARRQSSYDENEEGSSRRKTNIIASGETKAVIDVNRSLTKLHPFNTLNDERYELEKNERDLLEHNLWMEKILARRKFVKGA